MTPKWPFLGVQNDLSSSEGFWEACHRVLEGLGYPFHAFSARLGGPKYHLIGHMGSRGLWDPGPRKTALRHVSGFDGFVLLLIMKSGISILKPFLTFSLGTPHEVPFLGVFDPFWTPFWDPLLGPLLGVPSRKVVNLGGILARGGPKGTPF